jgi:TonB family protein
MNHLQKKCFVASAGFHLLLALTLLGGSAFRTQPGPAQGTLPLQLMSVRSDAEPASSVPPQADLGTPHVSAAAPRPIIGPREQPPATSDSAKDHRLNLPASSLTPVFRPPAEGASTKPASSISAQAAAFDHAIKAIGAGLAPRTSVSTDFGGAQADGSKDYAQFVKEVYAQNWDPASTGLSGDHAVTQVRVTIASDGRVMSARIVQLSGDVPADNAVKLALARVTFVKPFEAGAAEKQRTYTINFDLRSARDP